MIHGEPEIDLDLVVDDDAVAAKIFYKPRLQTTWGYTRTGSAKRHPKDEPNEALGEELAVGRALIKMGEALIASAEARIDGARYLSLPGDVLHIGKASDWATSLGEFS